MQIVEALNCERYGGLSHVADVAYESLGDRDS